MGVYLGIIWRGVSDLAWTAGFFILRPLRLTWIRVQDLGKVTVYYTFESWMTDVCVWLKFRVKTRFPNIKYCEGSVAVLRNCTMIMGGGWCNTLSSCSARKSTKLGSSNYMERQVQFSGILSHHPLQNPDFYNWNKVKVRYCDGASFSGNPESEFKNGTKLFFRGQVIWKTLMNELLSSGMAKAKQALLTGCSAGGLATLIHCDDFRELLPKDTDVKCLADAGFFPNEKDISGNSTIESFYHDVVHLQGLTKSLNHDCVARSEPHKCFFPQEFLRSLKTPIFLVQPAYDFWQIENILVPDAADPHGRWLRCKLNIFNCDPSQIDVLHGHRSSLLKMLSEYQQTPEVGMFVNSCFVHCQTWMTDTWHSPTSPRINNSTIAESVGDWYFKRDTVKRVDCPFPCNPTCYHMDFTRS